MSTQLIVQSFKMFGTGGTLCAATVEEPDAHAGICYTLYQVFELSRLMQNRALRHVL